MSDSLVEILFALQSILLHCSITAGGFFSITI